MKKKSYKRKPGDFEIRILNDGRVVMVAPDETLLEIGQLLRSEIDVTLNEMETGEHARIRNTEDN
jgi:hypothetical protein